MSLKSVFIIGIAALGFSSCSTVRRAHEAQEAVRPAAEGVRESKPQVRFESPSLASLVDYAMTNRPSVVSARLAVRDARLALKALAADAPIVSSTPWTALHLSATGGYSESSGGATVSSGDWRTYGDPSASLSLQLLVWDFGRYDAKAKAQAETVVAAEMSLADAGFTVFNEVSKAYLSYLERRKLLEVALTNEFEYAEHLRQSEARYEAGEVNRLNVLKARLDLATSRKATVAASNLVDTTGAELLKTLGIDAACGTHSQVFKNFDCRFGEVRRAFDLTTCSVGGAFDLARTNAPAMRVKRAQLRSASHSVDAAIADMLPQLSATASLNWTDPLWVWKWGVSATQSLFTGFKKTTAVDRAVVAMKTCETAVVDAEHELSVELETAIADRDNSIEALSSAMASLRSAEENLRVVRAQFSVGDVSRIELSEAIASHSVSAGDCITAFYDGQRAEAKLFVLLGRSPVYNERIERNGK